MHRRLTEGLAQKGHVSVEINGDGLKAHRTAVAAAHQAGKLLGIKVKTTRKGTMLHVDRVEVRENSSNGAVA